MATAKKKNAQRADGGRITFEDALSGLEDVTGKLEEGDLALDDALSVFEDGVKLMRVCDSHLRGARGRLAELIKGEDGELAAKILGEDIETFIGGESIDG